MSGTHTVTVDLLGNMAFRAITGTGHEVIMDAAREVGGTAAGPRPMELLLVGLGGCTGMDVISMLRKMRHLGTQLLGSPTESVEGAVDVYLRSLRGGTPLESVAQTGGADALDHHHVHQDHLAELP